MVITAAPLIGYSVTQPAPELVSLVRSMGWDDKIKLYRSPKGMSAAGKRSGDEAPGDDPDITKPAKKKSSTRKYVCPKCGLSIRATKIVRIACMDCGNV